MGFGVGTSISKKIKTLRAEVSLERFQAFEYVMVANNLSRRGLFAKLCDLVATRPEVIGLRKPMLDAATKAPTPPRVAAPKPPNTKLAPPPNVTIVSTPPRATETFELDRRIHINTRQHARFNRLLLLVPGCQLDVDPSLGKRDLLYPSSREEDVMRFLASCPKGNRNEAAERQESGRGEYITLRKRVLNAAERVLGGQSGPMSIDNLYSRLKELNCAPVGFSAKPDLRDYLEGCSIFDFNKWDDTCSLVGVVEPPTVDDDLLAQAMMADEEPPKSEGSPSSAVVVEPPSVEEPTPSIGVEEPPPVDSDLKPATTLTKWCMCIEPPKNR